VTIIHNDFARARTHEKIGYDWKSLPANALVVDVGGGVGTATLSLAKEFPHLKFVIQDRPAVVDAGVEVRLRFQVSQRSPTSLQVWKKELPGALSSGRVQFQGTYREILC